jgi:hypothetical protein
MTRDLAWHEANQRYLMARLALVREHISGDTEEGVRAVEDAARDLTGEATLDSLCTAFSLSAFERDVLLLCAGVELDGAQAEAPTFSVALARLPGAHWSAITPAAPLRFWRMIELGSGDTLTRCPLRIDERVLHYLTGLSYHDVRLQGFVTPATAVSDVAPSHREVAYKVAELLSRGAAVQLIGNDQGDKLAVGSLATTMLGVGLAVIEAANLPAATDRETLVRLWEREAVLSRSALLVDCEDADNRRALLSFVERIKCMLIVAAREPLRTPWRQMIRVDMSPPSVAEQKILWREFLGPAAERLNGHLDAVIANFRLGVNEIRSAGLEVRASLPDSGEVAPTMLWDVCRVQARARLDGLAQRIQPAASWNDLVLPEQQMQVLRDIAAQVRYRAKVYEEWGFADKGSRGLGISALFAGSSGTGKTMAAEVLANDLRLDLYRIDLSQVVSKYIGETEKNLQRVFDAAEESGAVLLFDEADALFGKRSEVRDSHDRYANIEVSYLLQRMEEYRGLAILTTNMKTLLDTAFLRRIRFIVQFPFPEASYRAEIWRRIFPAATPTEGLDQIKLANLNVAGGNIRNIAMQAAFLAAESGEPVRMRHLLRAARGEYAKLEKPLTDSETRGWG